MSRWLRKLDNHREPLGFETTLLKKMPVIFVGGSLLHGVLALSAHAWFGSEAARSTASIEIFLIASLITFWTAVVTVTIACFIVFVMKGPSFVADAYPLNDAPRPQD